MKNKPSSFSGQTDVCPCEPDPYIRQYEGRSDEQESYRRVLTRSSYAACVFQAAACLSAETFPVILMNRPQSQSDSVNSVGKVRYALPAVSSHAVNTYYPHPEGDRTVFMAVHRICGLIAPAAPDQLTGAPGPSPDNYRHFKRNIRGFQPSDDRDTEESSVGKKTSHSEIQRTYPVREPGDDRHIRIIPSDSGDGCGDPFAFSDNIQAWNEHVPAFAWLL